MGSKKSISTNVVFCLATALLLAAPALGQWSHTNQDSIRPGFDFWQTVGSGATFYNFAENPLPAGFLCKGSKPFTGKIAFEGVPLATEPAGSLGSTDTIIERLDAARFDSEGLASTTIQVRALNLEGRDKILTECGEFAVTAKLVGEQPKTAMHMQQSIRCSDVGVFTATLELNAEMSFTNTSSGATVSTVRHLVLPTFSDEPYTANRLAARCAVSNFPARGQVRVFDGTEVVFDVNGASTFAAGCWCNCDGTRCEPILPEHEGPDESHFTMPPCEFFGWTCDDDPIYTDHIYHRIDELHRAGVIDETAEEATGKLINKRASVSFNGPVND